MAKTSIFVPSCGDSMHPFIKEGCRLSINLYIKRFTRGDIVVFLDKNKLIAHRIIKIKRINNRLQYLTKGDNRRYCDGYLTSRKIIGLVEKIYFSDYQVDLTNIKHSWLKRAFVVYSLFNQKFPFLNNLRLMYKIRPIKSLYRIITVSRSNN